MCVTFIFHHTFDGTYIIMDATDKLLSGLELGLAKSVSMSSVIAS